MAELPEGTSVHLPTQPPGTRGNERDGDSTGSAGSRAFLLLRPSDAVTGNGGLSLWHVQRTRISRVSSLACLEGPGMEVGRREPDGQEEWC